MLRNVIFNKYTVRLWTGFIWLKRGSSEHGNEPLGSTKCGELQEQVSERLSAFQ